LRSHAGYVTPAEGVARCYVASRAAIRWATGRRYCGSVLPTIAQGYQQLEMFVFLSDVPEELGPSHLVSQRHTADLPANPNFYPRHGGHGEFVASDDHADLYDLEQSGAGPAGTVIAFNLGTFHRGTALTKPLR
jgi:hypothetical protein